jgi:16S rRNA (uracil1498-N3)-methyltransferase
VNEPDRVGSPARRVRHVGSRRDELRGSAAHVLVDDVAVPALSDEASHHLFRVLRLRDGEVVTVTDGCGRWRRCRAAASAVEVDGEVHVEEPPTWPVTIMLAIPKQDRPEWIVRRTTELGVDRIVFLHAERSVVRWDGERAERHLDKLRRLADESVMQARRVRRPVVAGPVDAGTVLAEAVVAEPGGRPIAPADRVIAIGPEGGWTDAELNTARGHVGLGPTILRVETAALAACAVMTALRG